MRDVQDELNKQFDDEELVHGTRDPHQGSDGATKNIGTDKVAAEATSIANEMQKGVEFLIRGAERIKEDLEKYSDQDVRVFIKQLAREGVIPENEGKLGRSSPSLSKLLAIAEQAKMLRNSDVAKLLPPNVSTVYHVAPLFKELQKMPEQDKQAALVRILKSCKKQVVTRQFLIDETKRLRAKRKSESDKTDSDHKPDHASPPSVGTSLSSQIQAGARFDLVVITAGKELDRIGRDYADGGTPQRLLPLHKVMDKDAALIAFGSISDLPVVVTKLLPLCGFKSRPRILLRKQPNTPDITDAEIVVLAERGDVISKAEEKWADSDGQLDPKAAALRMYPGSARRLHVLADRPAEGWVSLIGDDVWVEK